MVEKIDRKGWICRADNLFGNPSFWGYWALDNIDHFPVWTEEIIFWKDKDVVLCLKECSDWTVVYHLRHGMIIAIPHTDWCHFTWEGTC